VAAALQQVWAVLGILCTAQCRQDYRHAQECSRSCCSTGNDLLVLGCHCLACVCRRSCFWSSVGGAWLHGLNPEHFSPASAAAAASGPPPAAPALWTGAPGGAPAARQSTPPAPRRQGPALQGLGCQSRACRTPCCPAACRPLTASAARPCMKSGRRVGCMPISAEHCPSGAHGLSNALQSRPFTKQHGSQLLHACARASKCGQSSCLQSVLNLLTHTVMIRRNQRTAHGALQCAPAAAAAPLPLGAHGERLAPTVCRCWLSRLCSAPV
jgi:hypothetical protein